MTGRRERFPVRYRRNCPLSLSVNPFPRLLVVATTVLLASWSVSAAPVGRVGGKGKAGERVRTTGDFRGVIHSLLAEHEKVKRTVELTGDGYRARTISDDPGVAAALRRHVDQMASRLEGGLGVRHWDPAFAELREHYDDLDVRVENLEDGVAVSLVGKTPAAVKVAQNHAAILSDFVEKGGERKHATHPAVATSESVEAAEAAPPDPSANKPEADGGGKACGTCGKGDCGGDRGPCGAARKGAASPETGAGTSITPKT